MKKDDKFKSMLANNFGGVKKEDEEKVFEQVEDQELAKTLEIKLEQRKRQTVGRPRKGEVKDAGVGFISYCFVARQDLLGKFRAISRQETLPMKQLFEQVMSLAVEKYEKEHNTVLPIVKANDIQQSNKKIFK